MRIACTQDLAREKGVWYAQEIVSIYGGDRQPHLAHVLKSYFLYCSYSTFTAFLDCFVQHFPKLGLPLPGHRC